MAQVSRFTCDEASALDPARIVVLYAQLGDVAAEQVISTAMEDIAQYLVAVEKAAKAHQCAKMIADPDATITLAEQIGLSSLVLAAQNLQVCIEAHDHIAQAAVLARLMRLADRSLTEVWDLGDLRL
ncbi:hypothetical protein [Thioclava sp.]|uniref:hypothetical protein n=1 Tax=Thioclava sp. TaxID=1933450 RepID=UPI003AA8682C